MLAGIRHSIRFAAPAVAVAMWRRAIVRLGFFVSRHSTRASFRLFGFRQVRATAECLDRKICQSAM